MAGVSLEDVGLLHQEGGATASILVPISSAGSLDCPTPLLPTFLENSQP